MTQKYAQLNEYATSTDFCRIFVEQMNTLYLLSLLLTADSQKAEQCFLSGFEDSMNSTFVFRERAHLWARRSIILHAIRVLGPRPDDENDFNEERLLPLNGNVPAEVQAYPRLARIVELNSFERFIFVMSILEKYSAHECSLLLGCVRRDVINTRIAALRHLAGAVIGMEPGLESDVAVFAEKPICRPLSLSPGRAALADSFGSNTAATSSSLTVKSTVAEAGL